MFRTCSAVALVPRQLLLLEGPRSMFEGKKKKVRRTGKFKGTATGGGGAQRAFYSEYLRGKKYKTQDERRAVFTAAAEERKRVISGDAVRAASYLRIGKAGTASRRAGGYTFGQPSLKRKFDNRAVPTQADQVLDLVDLGLSVSTARASLREIGQMPSDAVRAKKRRCEEELNNVAAASQKRISEGSSSALWPPDPDLGVLDVRQAPQMDDMKLTVNPILPPVHEIGKRALEVLHHNHNYKEHIQADLLKEWEDAHMLRKHAEAGCLPPLGPGKEPLGKLTLCRRVGYCMCSQAMRSRALFREALVRQLGAAFVKGSACRSVYDRGIAVIRLYSQIATSSPQTFWFLGMGNLNDHAFTVKRLHKFEPELSFVPPGTEVFSAGSAEDRPVDIEVVGSDLVFAPGYTYAIEILKLDVDNAALVPEHFGPLACVVSMDPPVFLSVWPVVRAARTAAAAPPPKPKERGSPLVLFSQILNLEYLKHVNF